MHPNKIQFRKTDVKYLGIKFSGKGRQIDNDRIESIRKLKNPVNKKELQKQLGVINYFRDFVPQLAEITTPRELLKKNVLSCYLNGMKYIRDQWEKLKIFLYAIMY